MWLCQPKNKNFFNGYKYNLLGYIKYELKSEIGILVCKTSLVNYLEGYHYGMKYILCLAPNYPKQYVKK